MKDPGVLVLLCGLPGSGKTTLAKRLEEKRVAVRLSPDEWIEAILADPLDVSERNRLRDPVENLQWDLAQTSLAKGMTVILENGFWSEEDRSAYALRALELGAAVELHYLAASQEVLWTRIQDRNERLGSPTFLMTREEVEFGWRAFEPPTREELDFYDEGSDRIV